MASDRIPPEVEAEFEATLDAYFSELEARLDEAYGLTPPDDEHEQNLVRLTRAKQRED